MLSGIRRDRAFAIECLPTSFAASLQSGENSANCETDIAMQSL
jgi:hypothetical protein